MKSITGKPSRRRVLGWLGGCVLLGSGSAQAQMRRLVGFRIVQQDTVLLHVDTDIPVPDAHLFMLDEPHRLVIDLPDTSLATDLPVGTFPEGIIRSVRHGQREDGALRIVIDLRRALTADFHQINRQGGQRLLVDLGVKGQPGLTESRHRRREPAALRNVVVAIDAGHGGKDPGAIGEGKTREKDVVLKVARRLYRYLAAHQGVSPVMTREDDTYVGLRDRLTRARDRGADVFVSVHADAFKRREAHGSSVYALSRKGASSEAARWLAVKETEQAALFGEVNLDGMNADLATTILDLAQNTTLESSLDLAGEVLDELKKVGPVHKKQVEQAGFAVLKSPDVPSILVETAFISNPEEERKLNDDNYIDRLAVAVGTGIMDFLTRRPPHGTVLFEARAMRTGRK